MPSGRTKRWAFNGLLAIVWIGVPVFCVKTLYPAWATATSGVRELGAAQTKLSTWVRQGNLPTRTKIEAAEEFRDGLLAEYESVKSYFRRRDRMLERPLLETYTGDPRQIKNNYTELKAQLMARGHYGAVEGVFRGPFMPEYPWEAPTLVPSPDEFESLEKKACVAEALVGLLGGGQPCIIGYIGVSDPLPAVPEDSTADLGGGGEAEPSASYVIWPVEMRFLVPFMYVAPVLSRLSASPPEYPPIVIRGLRVEAYDAARVVVAARLGVLDFN